MKIKFVIKELHPTGDVKGFYDSAGNEFRPRLELDRITQYDVYEEAQKRVEKLSSGIYQIDKLFIIC